MDDWHDLLPIAEFAYNSSHHATIGMSPSRANYGYNPRMSLKAFDDTVPNVTRRLGIIERTHETARENIAKALEQHTLWANNRRIPPPEFQAGDMVLLRRYNPRSGALQIKSKRPMDKLDAKKIGPFEIIRPLGINAFRLRLPASMQCHPTFHVSMLEKYVPARHPERRTQAPEFRVEGYDDQHYAVERILDSRISRGRLEYFIKYVGYPEEDNCWGLASDLPDDDPLVIDFHTSHPQRPGYRERIGSERRRQRFANRTPE